MLELDKTEDVLCDRSGEEMAHVDVGSLPAAPARSHGLGGDVVAISAIYSAVPEEQKAILDQYGGDGLRSSGGERSMEAGDFFGTVERPNAASVAVT